MVCFSVVSGTLLSIKCIKLQRRAAGTGSHSLTSRRGRKQSVKHEKEPELGGRHLQEPESFHPLGVGETDKEFILTQRIRRSDIVDGTILQQNTEHPYLQCIWFFQHEHCI